MGTRIITTNQSLAEIRIHFIDFSTDLPEDVTVLSATATHYPPGGAASTPAVSVAQAPQVQVTFGPLEATGIHQVSVLATLSDGEKIEARLCIPVDF
jgi:hypothetical protein